MRPPRIEKTRTPILQRARGLRVSCVSGETRRSGTEERAPAQRARGMHSIERTFFALSPFPCLPNRLPESGAPRPRSTPGAWARGRNVAQRREGAKRGGCDPDRALGEGLMSRKGAETPRGHIRRFLGVFASLREIPVDRAQDWIRLGEKASETIGPTVLPQLRGSMGCRSSHVTRPPVSRVVVRA